MRTAEERRAAFVLLALAGAGLLVRLIAGSGAPPGELAYRSIAGERPVQDSVAARAARFVRPLAPGEKIDLDRAPADELVRLPRIGPALARRIVAYRETHGPFGILEVVDSVPGVGPTTLESLRPHAVFSGRPNGVRRQAAANPLVSLNTASAAQLAQLPGIGPVRARAILEDRRRRGPYRRLDDLTRVRGIGAETITRLRGRVRLP